MCMIAIQVPEMSTCFKDLVISYMKSAFCSVAVVVCIEFDL